MDRKKAGFEICPLRSLDDFLLESARFQIPNVKDPDKWANRVIHNLLYYQTNYFLLGVIIFLTVGVLHPVQMFVGMMAITLALVLVYYAFSASESVARMKTQYPVISIILLLIGGYLILYMMGSVIVFLLGVLLPVMAAFIHASMRLRSIKNKIFNKKELISETRTPMGLILCTLGIEREFLS
ncbi:PRA1 family protein 3 [Anabrus simplex]|uniref:PRA1 family protein 3 n=1 Tax=Anabrus simplex TaxID=316456 RepID=UPI0034DCFD8E